MAGTAEEHAAAVLRIMEDPAERRRLSVAGRARVLARHEWGHALGRFDGIIERCLTAFERSAVHGGFEAHRET